jgi:serine phosphatase RsbU (regulator of sigma subunit)
MEGAGVEFHRGNQRRRLIDALKLRRQQALTEALDAVIHTVRDFGGDDQADDLTLILVRGVM